MSKFSAKDAPKPFEAADQARRALMGVYVNASLSDKPSFSVSEDDVLLDDKQLGDYRRFRLDFVCSLPSGIHAIYERAVRPVIKKFIKGESGSVILYGQSGTGKLALLEGSSSGTAADRGLIFRALEQIFTYTNSRISNPNRSGRVVLTLSCLQLRNDHISDLLILGNTNLKVVDGFFGSQTGLDEQLSLFLAEWEETVQKYESAGLSPSKIPKRDLPVSPELQEQLDRRVGTSVLGLMETVLESTSDALEALQKARIVEAVLNQQAGSHRDCSHVVYTLYLYHYLDGTTSPSKRTVVHFVDLAASEKARERQGPLSPSERQRLAVTFSSVVNCIVQFCQGSRAVPVRQCKLTHVLKDSFSPSSLISVIAAVSPRTEDYVETIASLRWIDRLRHLCFDVDSTGYDIPWSLPETSFDFSQQSSTPHSALSSRGRTPSQKGRGSRAQSPPKSWQDDLTPHSSVRRSKDPRTQAPKSWQEGLRMQVEPRARVNWQDTPDGDVISSINRSRPSSRAQTSRSTSPLSASMRRSLSPAPGPSVRNRTPDPSADFSAPEPAIGAQGTTQSRSSEMDSVLQTFPKRTGISGSDFWRQEYLRALESKKDAEERAEKLRRELSRAIALFSDSSNDPRRASPAAPLKQQEAASDRSTAPSKRRAEISPESQRSDLRESERPTSQNGLTADELQRLRRDRDLLQAEYLRLSSGSHLGDVTTTQNQSRSNSPVVSHVSKGESGASSNGTNHELRRARKQLKYSQPEGSGSQESPERDDVTVLGHGGANQNRLPEPAEPSPSTARPELAWLAERYLRLCQAHLRLNVFLCWKYFARTKRLHVLALERWVSKQDRKRLQKGFSGFLRYRLHKRQQQVLSERSQTLHTRFWRIRLRALLARWLRLSGLTQAGHRDLHKQNDNVKGAAPIGSESDSDYDGFLPSRDRRKDRSNQGQAGLTVQELQRQVAQGKKVYLQNQRALLERTERERLQIQSWSQLKIAALMASGREEIVRIMVERRRDRLLSLVFIRWWRWLNGSKKHRQEELEQKINGLSEKLVEMTSRLMDAEQKDQDLVRRSRAIREYLEQMNSMLSTIADMEGVTRTESGTLKLLPAPPITQDDVSESEQDTNELGRLFGQWGAPAAEPRARRSESESEQVLDGPLLVRWSVESASRANQSDSESEQAPGQPFRAHPGHWSVAESSSIASADEAMPTYAVARRVQDTRQLMEDSEGSDSGSEPESTSRP